MSGTDISTALNDLLFTPTLKLDEALDRHFTPDYRQRTDGTWSDRSQFSRHIAHLRTLVAAGRVEVHEELREGLRYADRHSVDITKHDGSTARTEVYLFGEYAPDGRFRRIEETTMLTLGSGADRTLGTARGPQT